MDFAYCEISNQNDLGKRVLSESASSTEGDNNPMI